MVAALQKYTRLQIGLHWLIALLFVANWFLSEGMGRALRTKLEGGVPEGLIASIHPPIGLAILVLMVIRIILRLVQGAPALPESGSSWMNTAAKLGHQALYAVLLAIPASGIAAWGIGIREAAEAHEVLVNLGVILVLGHIAMAFYHQLVLKDGLIARMKF